MSDSEIKFETYDANKEFENLQFSKNADIVVFPFNPHDSSPQLSERQNQISLANTLVNSGFKVNLMPDKPFVGRIKDSWNWFEATILFLSQNYEQITKALESVFSLIEKESSPQQPARMKFSILDLERGTFKSANATFTKENAKSVRRMFQDFFKED